MNRMDGSGDADADGVGASVSVSECVYCILKNFNRRFSYHLNYHIHTYTNTKAPTSPSMIWVSVCMCIQNIYAHIVFEIIDENLFI